MTQLWCNSNLTCRATHWMYLPSFKLISQSMLKKSPENADGRTDGRTDGPTDGRTLPRHNTSRFSNGHIKPTTTKEQLIAKLGNNNYHRLILGQWVQLPLLVWKIEITRAFVIHSPKECLQNNNNHTGLMPYFYYHTEAGARWPPVCRQHFHIHFVQWNLLYSYSYFMEIHSQWSSWWYASNGSNHGLVPNHYVNQWWHSLLIHSAFKIYPRNTKYSQANWIV